MNIHLVNHNNSLFDAIEKSTDKLNLSISLSDGVDQVVKEIQENKSQIVVINWAKGDFDIVKLCKKIKSIKIVKYIYILVVTVRERQNKLENIINSGVDDFIIKPFGKQELEVRFRLAIKDVKLHESAKKTKKNLIKYSKEDAITSLLNRRALMDEVLNEMGRASREMKYISTLMTNITNFEDIVDLYGDVVGSDVLAEFSRRLKRSCRTYDKVGRYGISEFLVFLPSAGINYAERVAKRLLPEITDKPFMIKGNKINVNTSIGLSELDPDDVSRSNHVDDHLLNDIVLDSLIKRAEFAMNKANKLGKNKMMTYTFI